MKKLVWMACTQMVLLSMTACGPQGEGRENATLKTFSIDSSLQGKVALKSCTDLASCEKNEVVFVHGPTGKTFERGYHGDGFISFEGDSLLWNSGETKVAIGNIVNNAVTTLCSGEFEQVCDLDLSIKHPNEASEPQEPFRLATFRLRQQSEMTRMADTDSSRTSLLEFVIQSPNQENAGTCNHMAATGAMEVLLNQWKKSKGYKVDTNINGASDLSEPYSINTSIYYGYGNTLVPFLAYNQNGYGALLNKKFPFLNSFHGYDAEINWKRKTPYIYRIGVPSVKALIHYGGTTLNDNTKWSVANLNENHIEAVKRELRKNRPVLITYNHYDFWHVVVVVGYDDEISENCQMVRSYIANPNSSSGARVKAALDRDGGNCREKGVFYVRDSLGMGARAPKYSVRSYDWLKYLGNHIISVYH